jgi:beta-glucosidase
MPVSDLSATADLIVPTDLELGVATSSWQIEGDLAGRGRCIWDDFAEIPGAIIDGATAEPACDHVSRLEEDLDLLAWLGVDAYRFSISWPRVQPGGSGPVSPAGIGFYDRLVDGLLARGIRPVATLYHWDLPSELAALGGWLNRSTAERFAEYTHVTAQRLGDRVGGWATLNEPWVSAYLGYAAGIHAPGVRDPESSLSAAYHLMLAHGQAMLSLREVGARECGIVLNCQPIWADDDSIETAAAVRHIDGLHNRFFLDLLAGRGVPDDLRESCAPFTDFSFVRDSDLPSIATPLDWIGENYYTVARVSTPGESATRSVGAELSAYPGTPACSFAPRPPLTEMGWEIVPEGLTEILTRIAEALPGVPIWVTENGAAIDDALVDGRVADEERTDYIRGHIAAALAARDSGVPVKGYFAWSLLDNIEWAEGLTKRFGIVHVDPVTQQRTPKDSAHWLRGVIAARLARQR